MHGRPQTTPTLENIYTIHQGGDITECPNIYYGFITGFTIGYGYYEVLLRILRDFLCTFSMLLHLRPQI